MKKSTKIILIASGTVILVSVILIIVLALTINAKVITPSPENSQEAVICDNSGYPLDTPGIIITLKGERKKLNDTQWQIDLSWNYGGNSLSWMKERYRLPDSWTGDARSTTGMLKLIKNTEFENTDNGFEPGHRTFIVTPNQGDKYTYKLSQYVCWEKTAVVINPFSRPFKWYKNIVYSNSVQVEFADLDNPTIDDSNPGGSVDPSTSDEVDEGCGCDQEKGLLAKISCTVTCGFFHFFATLFNWSWNVMLYYSGMPTKTGEPAPTEVPNIDIQPK